MRLVPHWFARALTFLAHPQVAREPAEDSFYDPSFRSSSEAKPTDWLKAPW